MQNDSNELLIFPIYGCRVMYQIIKLAKYRNSLPLEDLIARQSRNLMHMKKNIFLCSSVKELTNPDPRSEVCQLVVYLFHNNCKICLFSIASRNENHFVR